MIEIKKNTIHCLEILLTDVIGEFVDNEIIKYFVYKSIDNTLVLQGELIYFGQGIYQKSIKLSEIGQHRVIYEAPIGYANSSESLMVIEDQTINIETMSIKLNKILGLGGENQIVFNMKFDSKDRLISADTKIYSNKEDTDSDINPIATYRSFATYDSFNKIVEIKRVKI